MNDRTRMFEEVYYKLLNSVREVRYNLIEGNKICKIQVSPEIRHILLYDFALSCEYGKLGKIWDIPIEAKCNLHEGEVRIFIINETYNIMDEHGFNLTDVHYRYVTFNLNLIKRLV